ncbi:MAG: ABC transporter permease [Spirochaetes bacterium]|nr:ABC transporter permease [Spirochaetota bacterium]
MILIKSLKNFYPLVAISWRNLWRQKRRSLVVITSIGIGIFAMILTVSFMNGMIIQMLDNSIRTALGHVAIHRKGFQDNMKLSLNFIPDDRLYQLIRGNSSIIAYAPRVKIKGMLRTSESSQGVMIVGIDPRLERGVSSIHEYTSQKNGSRYLSDASANEILISRTMAEKHDVLLHDRVVLMLQDRNEDLIGEGLTVTGIFESPMGSLDKSVVFIGMAKLQSMTGLGSNISEITIVSDDKNRADSIRDYIVKGLNTDSLEILSWKDMAPNLASLIQLQDSMIVIYFVLIFITVIFSVANTLIMSIVERFHELGVMKCIGTRPSYIFFMVIFEALNLGIVGIAAGLLAGLPLVYLAGYTGIDFSFALESARKWGVGSEIYPFIRPEDIIAATCLVLMTTVVASLYPAVKAARIKPLDALNYL